MVVAAEGDGVAEVGGAALGPGIAVVEFGPGVGPVAAVGGTGGVAGGEGEGLGVGEEPGGVAEVEEVGFPAEDGGEESGLAGHPPGGGGGDHLAGVDAGGLQLGDQLVVVEGDDDGGGGFVVQPVGGQVVEDFDERLSEASVPGEAVDASGRGGRRGRGWRRVWRGGVRRGCAGFVGGSLRRGWGW